MKKQLIIAVALIFATISFQNASAQKADNDLTGKIGVSLYGGLSIPTNGDYSEKVKSTDLLNLGPQFGLGVSYFFNESIGVELNGNYSWNFYKDDFKPEGMSPVMSMFNIMINGIYNFHSMMPNSFIAPYVKAGVGMYSWRQLDDGLGGEVMKTLAGDDVKGTSFGFNIGVGGDVQVAKNFTIGLEVNYNMYFPKDEDKFGKDFAAQGYLTPQLKFSYYFPTK